MLDRRSFVVAAALWPLAGRPAALPDVLVRPAQSIRPASKPAMARVARAGKRLVAVGERGVVLLSDDAGRGWRQAAVPVSVSLTGVQFVDARRGWAIGHSAVILRTTDGGETWSSQFDGRRAEADGAIDKPLLDLHFVDERRGWVVGAYGIAFVTDDAGATWHSAAERLPNPKGLHLYAIARHGNTLFVAGEQGLFLAVGLDAAGDVAVALTTPYRGSFFALAALPGDTLLLAGLRGTALLRNGAGEYQKIESGTSLAIVSVTPLSPGRQALVDQSGRVQLGDAWAGRFTTLPTDAARRWNAVTLAPDGTLVGACNVGVGRIETEPGAA